MSYLGKGVTVGEVLSWGGSGWESGAAVITDWVSYSPTFTAAAGGATVGNGTLEGWWRRIGDSMEVMVALTWGSTTSAGSGESRFSIPSGFTVDDSKKISDLRGVCWAYDSSASGNRHAGIGIVVNSAGEELRTLCDNNSTTDATNPFTWASGDSIQFITDFPVLEWG